MLQSARFHTQVYCLLTVVCTAPLQAEVKTWDGKHSTEKVAVKVVYFLPKDRQPLSDWHDRASYYCDRITQFHEREYGGQSTLTTELVEAPFVSELSTAQLREGDGDAIFFKTLREVDARLQFAQNESETFPILLVLSEINWRPLDDFYRLKPGENGWEFEGNFSNQQHFPGATSGGARATYLANQGKGWGLVSADGWRVPYRGSDCVVYHEGVGHTVGLPHPQPQNGSVMSLGQYRGWISESWLDKEQKIHMNWNPEKPPALTSQQKMFSEFRAIQSPLIPKPGETVSLQFDWPEAAQVKSCVVEYQTAIEGPWIESVNSVRDASLTTIDQISLGAFDRPTPVSYRVKASLVDGAKAELWGYFQVRNTPQEFPVPTSFSSELAEKQHSLKFGKETDLLKIIDTETFWQNGGWTKDEAGRLLSPKKYGARIELPGEVPRNYRVVIVAEPLDSPNGLLIGSLMDKSRFATLINYMPGETGMSALENVDGKNFGNITTLAKNLLVPNRLTLIVVTVNQEQVVVEVDGQTIIDWSGTPDRLSLGDYWKTPNENSLFLGAYDCRYRFHRVGLLEILK